MPDVESPNIDALMHEHWLLSDQMPGRGLIIVGCHCGFRADLDADCGYGDSVVRHLFEVACGESPDADRAHADMRAGQRRPPEESA